MESSKLTHWKDQLKKIDQLRDVGLTIYPRIQYENIQYRYFWSLFPPLLLPQKSAPPHFKITIPLKWQYKELFLCNNGAYTIDFKANLLLLFIGCGGSLGLSNIFSQFCNPSSQPSLTLSCPRSHFTVRFNLNQLFNYFFKVCYQKKIL